MAALKTKRQEKIRQLIRREGQLTVAEMCAQFNISEATARRDLEELSDQGALHRTHGGARRHDSIPPEPPVLLRLQEQEQAKDCIGQAAAELVADGETIFLGSGSTALAVARHLQPRRGLSVISNSLPIINLLADVPDLTLIILGGLLRRSELSMIGHITEHALGELRADKVIMGMRAIHPEQGLTSDYLPETRTDRAIVKLSAQIILVADHSKFGQVAPAFVAPLGVVDTIVTDAGIAAHTLIELNQTGVRVIVAPDSKSTEPTSSRKRFR
jgi:DeoR/GlpR family transcriptional regulator of sugar metabolism